MRKKPALLIFLLGLASSLHTGCTGIGVPYPFQRKPYTLLRGGDTYGRDQLMNRTLVADFNYPIKGMDSNDVLSLLGQPQQVEVKERNVAEDWYYVYYKHYKMWPKTHQGTFLVRVYNRKVLDVVELN